MRAWARRYGWVALLLLAVVGSRAYATGSLAVPNTFQTQAGNVPVAQLDSNFTTFRDYINAREITQGFFAARPAAGTAGRWYLATDVAGGTLYADNGSSWVQVAEAVASTVSTTLGGTGGNFAATLQGNLWYFSATGTIAALAPGTSGQVLQTQGAGANPVWATSGGFWSDPVTSYILWEDFQSVAGAGTPPPFTFPSGTWGQAGGTSISYNGGTVGTGSIQVITGAGSNGALSLWKINTASLHRVASVTANPSYYTRWTQVLNNTGTRRIGLADLELWQDPTNGLYFRHAASGVIFGVTRNAGVDSTVSCGTSAAVGTFHRGLIEVTGAGTNVNFYLDGTICASGVTTNIPTTRLGLSMGMDNLATADGLEVDYVVLKQTRE